MKFNSSIAASAFALALVAPASAQFSVSGPGGPLADTTGGDRCTMLPPVAGSFPLVNPVPTCATNIKSVTLVGLAHSWSGDVQVVLTNPMGVGYNLITRLATPATTSCTALGYTADFGSNYTLVAATDPYLDSFWPAVNPGAAVVIPGGLYGQHFGSWVDGSAGVFNTDLASIPAVPGIWTLNIYDGAAGDTGSIVSWCMDGNTTFGEFPSGAGGPIPAAGTGGGTWPTVLPTSPSIFPLSVPVGSCGRTIRSITLTGISHTWAGDVHVVLESPSLLRYNILHRVGNGGPGNGHSADFVGNTFNIADPSDPNINQAWPLSNPAGFVDGNYPQFFGTWATGNLGINNTPLGQVPVEAGTWTLYIYDWAGGDIGTLAGGWAMLVTNPVTANVCNGNVNTTGLPAVYTTTGSVQLAANTMGAPTELMLHVNQLPLNVFGYFVMGNACNQVVIQMPLSQGVVCVGGRTIRGLGNQIVNTGMMGTVSIPAQLYENMPGTNGLPTGLPAIAGQRIYSQFWFRDSNMGMAGSNLSNALFFTVRP